jgi:YVTN family beta-propeller protein
MKRLNHLVNALACLIAVNAHGQTDAIKIVPPSLIMELLGLNGDIETAAKPKYFTPTALVASPDGKTLYVAEQTAKQVVAVNCAGSNVTMSMPMPNEPTGLAISRDGATLYVTCASQQWPNGMVCVVSTANGRVQKRIPAGHMARSPVLSPDGTTLYVCNWLGNNISVLDIAAGKETARIQTMREPYAAAVTPDGATLVVTNSLPDQKAIDTNVIGSRVLLIDTRTKAVSAAIELRSGSHSMFGVCISVDGKYAFATHLIASFLLPATSLTNGFVHTNNLAIIDIASKTLANDIALDDYAHGASNPWGIACAPDGKFLCTVHAGSNELMIIDLPQMLDSVIGAPDLFNDVYREKLYRKRVPVAVKAPRALAIIGSKAYVAGTFADALNVFDITMSTSGPAATIALGPSKPLNAERTGEYLFADASLCFQNWQSCFSCHPFGRPDALNWILNTSESNAPKNAKSMLYTFQTPPTNWSGRRANAFLSVEKGIELELQTVPVSEMTLPLDSFLMRMKPIPSPFLVKGRLSAAAQRGRDLYFGAKVDCADCHAGPLFTDCKRYNAGVTDPSDMNTSWDTPSLIESWRTAPYDHIGSTLTLEEILRVPGHSIDMGKLNAQEFSDLVEFVKSL